MKIKKEYIALIAIIAALGLYLVFDSSDSYLELPEPETIDKSRISRIVIEKPNIDVELEKTDNGWIISPHGYTADKSRVEPMIDAIQNLELTALVSEQENYYPYELDPDHRIRVTTWDGEEKLRSFDIGKPAPSNRHTFVKLPDDLRVYHADSDLRAPFEKEVAELRDKTVLAFEKSRARQLKIEKGEKSLELGLAEPGESSEDSEEPAPGWQTADGDPVDTTEVDQLLSAVNNLKCQSFLDIPETEYTDEVYTLTITGDETHTLRIYEKDEEEDNYPATSTDSEQPFELAGYKAEEIMKILSE